MRLYGWIASILIAVTVYSVAAASIEAALAMITFFVLNQSERILVKWKTIFDAFHAMESRQKNGRIESKFIGRDE